MLQWGQLFSPPSLWPCRPGLRGRRPSVWWYPCRESGQFSHCCNPQWSPRFVSWPQTQSHSLRSLSYLCLSVMSWLSTAQASTVLTTIENIFTRKTNCKGDCLHTYLPPTTFLSWLQAPCGLFWACEDIYFKVLNFRNQNKIFPG